MLLYMYGHKKGGFASVPKGRPTQAKKDKRFEIRLTSETYSTLEECAERLNLSKAQVIHKGIELV